MRLNVAIIYLIIFPVSVWAQDTITFQGKRIPQVTIQDAKGNNYNTAEMSNDGKPFVVVFWKTCCKPPLRELSALNAVYDDWKEQTGVKIYAVSVDDARATNTVKPYVNGQGWEFDVLLDPNQTLKRSMNVIGLPHTFVLNGSGEIVGQKVLYAEGDENDILEMIRKTLPIIKPK